MVRVSAARRADLLADLRERMLARRGFTVATLNLDHVVKLRADARFRAAYAAHSHVTADGNPIVWLSRVAGRPVELVPGSDLIDPVAALAAAARVPVALLGSTEEALRAARDALVSRHPGLEVVLTLSPPMGFDPTGPAADQAIAEVRASGARLCFLALGAPKQEVLAARASAALPEVGFLSIGAGLDFLAGRQRRAPSVMRALALEWLWRLAGNPRRLAARYAACAAVLPGLTLTALRARSAARVSAR
ncbi:MAG: WecB/TagA/CpsF family glycosyltransferase [Rhodobacteraceae bacterium]|jgi:exopolysaccharide biosynthesis WecB/TagA/CpsF family protein|nr:WecB/TagA/CpsF family glycosyltransferase [Paracoccaceae bacterium]